MSTATLMITKVLGLGTWLNIVVYKGLGPSNHARHHVVWLKITHTIE